MIGLYKDSNGIHGINYFQKNSDGIINENNLKMFYRVNDEIIELSKQGLILNLDNITFSQNKFTNTCLNSEYILKNNNTVFENFGSISNDEPSNSQCNINAQNKTLRIKNCYKLNFEFNSNIFDNNELTIYITCKISYASMFSKIFWLYNGKNPRLQYNGSSWYLCIANSVGTMNPDSVFTTLPNIDRSNWFNLCFTVHNSNLINLFQNGTRYGNTDYRYNDLVDTNLRSIGIFNSNNDNDAIIGEIKTLRVYKRKLELDEIQKLVKIDKLI